MNERLIPQAALRDQNLVEMLRLRVAEHKLHLLTEDRHVSQSYLD